MARTREIPEEDQKEVEPTVRTVRMRINNEDAETEDVYDVVRAIFWELRNSIAHGSTKQLEREIGVSQQNLHTYFSVENPRNLGPEGSLSGGMRMSVLTAACLHLNETPVEFFRRYAPEQPAGELAERQNTLARIRRQVRSLDDLKDLAAILEVMNHRDALQAQLEALAKAFGVDRSKSAPKKSPRSNR